MSYQDSRSRVCFVLPGRQGPIILCVHVYEASRHGFAFRVVIALKTAVVGTHKKTQIVDVAVFDATSPDS